MADPTVLIGQIIDYRNDSELARQIDDVDAEFQQQTGMTYDEAVSEHPHDAEWAETWLQLFQRYGDAAVQVQDELGAYLLKGLHRRALGLELQGRSTRRRPPPRAHTLRSRTDG